MSRLEVRSLRLVTLSSGITQTSLYEFSGVVDKMEYRNAGGTLVGTDDFTYDAQLRRTGASSRLHGIRKGL